MASFYIPHFEAVRVDFSHLEKIHWSSFNEKIDAAYKMNSANTKQLWCSKKSQKTNFFLKFFF